MFKIVKEQRAWWPVTWPGVTEEGTVIENRIEMRFRLLKVDEAFELFREATQAQDVARIAETAASADASEAQQLLSQSYTETLMRFATDWRGVQAENGEPLPWAPDNVRLLMNEPGVFNRALEAFRDCIAGRRAAIEGN